jgi:hypothetical protein
MATSERRRCGGSFKKTTPSVLEGMSLPRPKDAAAPILPYVKRVGQGQIPTCFSATHGIARRQKNVPPSRDFA